MSGWRQVTVARDRLGESPFWHPGEQALYWVDIPARQLRRLRRLRMQDGAGESAAHSVESWAMPADPGCIAPARSGGLVVALRDGIYRARTWGGTLERIAPALHDGATTRFNDGKADPSGRLWAGTIYEPRDARRAALYTLDARDGPATLRQVAGDAVTLNGVAWSPDAKTAYWSDTPGHVTYAAAWDGATNALQAPRVFRQFAGKPEGWQAGQPAGPSYGGRPDGAAVDQAGNYWCAMYEGARLLQLSPDGEVLQEVPVPAQCPTMPCFGGDDLRTLYLTTASDKRPAGELAALPWSGHVLSMRVQVPGLPVNFFVD